ncbi:hypothetical protein ACFOQM_01360 [Paenibacillus sp. GCM10012307]|uniref:hypothetical protein n=1 Tax=Paenibacillus sp. GCM10012307 TaxID=3317343 RepID=UPI0036188710
MNNKQLDMVLKGMLGQYEQFGVHSFCWKYWRKFDKSGSATSLGTVKGWLGGNPMQLGRDTRYVINREEEDSLTMGFEAAR